MPAPRATLGDRRRCPPEGRHSQAVVEGEDAEELPGRDAAGRQSGTDGTPVDEGKVHAPEEAVRLPLHGIRHEVADGGLAVTGEVLLAIVGDVVARSRAERGVEEAVHGSDVGTEEAGKQGVRRDAPADGQGTPVDAREAAPAEGEFAAAEVTPAVGGGDNAGAAHAQGLGDEGMGVPVDEEVNALHLPRQLRGGDGAGSGLGQAQVDKPDDEVRARCLQVGDCPAG